MYNTLYDISKIINLSCVYIEYKEPNQFFTIFYKPDSFKNLNKAFESINIDLTKYIIDFSRSNCYYRSIIMDIKDYSILNFITLVKKQDRVYFKNDKIYKNNIIKLRLSDLSISLFNKHTNISYIGFIDGKMYSTKNVKFYDAFYNKCEISLVLPELNI